MFCKHCVFMTKDKSFMPYAKKSVCCSNAKVDNRDTVTPETKMCSLGIVRASAKQEIQEMAELARQRKLLDLEMQKRTSREASMRVKTKIIEIANIAKQLSIECEIPSSGIILLTHLSLTLQEKWAVYVEDTKLLLYHKNEKGDTRSYHLQRVYTAKEIPEMLDYVVNHKNISFSRKTFKVYSEQ